MLTFRAYCFGARAVAHGRLIRFLIENKVHGAFSSTMSLSPSPEHRSRTFTGNKWKIPDLPELRRWFSKYDSLNFGEFAGYDYLVFLRHHGFPSPLLDLT